MDYHMHDPQQLRIREHHMHDSQQLHSVEQKAGWQLDEPTVSPVSDWNWMMTLAGSAGGSRRAILAGGAPLPLAMPGLLKTVSCYDDGSLW